jgi:drug/metabolite transporter (DMT)-like permease
MRGIRAQPWYLNPYFQLGIIAILISAAEILLKKGATASVAVSDGQTLLAVAALSWSVTWIGIALYLLSFISWLHVLRLIPLTQAYSLLSIVHVLVPTAAWVFLQESISLTRAAGIALVLSGIFLTAGAAAEAEAKL